ncbi:MAG TPA: hypothetical protein VGQ41_26385 [Pyrinomonadaceae bacterium]|jgi:hypothetical protein|nr:hypothetical protein [Pyrinomonadaceae bacterium]
MSEENDDDLIRAEQPTPPTRPINDTSERSSSADRTDTRAGSDRNPDNRAGSNRN